MEHELRSENNMQELGFSFQHVAPRDWSLGLAVEVFSLWATSLTLIHRFCQEEIWVRPVKWARIFPMILIPKLFQINGQNFAAAKFLILGKWFWLFPLFILGNSCFFFLFLCSKHERVLVMCILSANWKPFFSSNKPFQTSALYFMKILCQSR